MYYVQPVLSPSRGSASFRLGAHGLRRGLYSVAASRLELAPRGKRLGSQISALRDHNFCSCDGLPHMTLGVVGDVNEQSHHGRGQLFSADSPDLVERVYVERPNPPRTLADGRRKF